MGAPFTPGPWSWIDYPDGRKMLTAANRAVIHCPVAPMSVSPGDARLLAAAPDLLAACRAALPRADTHDIRDILAAAITKAEGGIP